MAFFQYKGKKCYYEEYGEGEPLLFLHGNAASSAMFSWGTEFYCKDYKVVYIDFLGHGRSERVERLEADLWYDEAQQVIAFLTEKKYKKASIIGTSGGALVAINVALERPDLVDKVIADSFEGERSLKSITENVAAEREASKQDEGAREFFAAMHGEDWEHVVDCDTQAVIAHDKTVGAFFHKPLEELKAEILLTGSREDEFVCALGDDYFDKVYGEILRKIGHGKMHLFQKGGHPAMVSNAEQFIDLALEFLKEEEDGTE
jgi:pimeloyl-ACP methyl ester carboxylesterase